MIGIRGKCTGKKKKIWNLQKTKIVKDNKFLQKKDRKKREDFYRKIEEIGNEEWNWKKRIE